MVRANRLIALASLMLASASLTGCATMYHHNNKLRVTMVEDGQRVPRLVMNMDHVPQGLRVFDGDREVTVASVPDKIWSTAVHNSLAQATASTSCAGATTPCTYSWTVSEPKRGPGLYLDPRGPHTLRLVDGTRETTVMVRTHWKPKWYFYDMALLVFGPIGWIVDGATGSWNQFPRLDVERAFRNSTMTTSRGSHE